MMSDMMLITIKVTVSKLNKISAENEDENASFKAVATDTFTSIFKDVDGEEFEVARIEHTDEEVTLYNSDECSVLESIILTSLISPFAF